MPFIFVYQPALLLQASLPGYPFCIIDRTYSCALMAMAAEGWYGRDLNKAHTWCLIHSRGLLTLTGYLPLWLQQPSLYYSHWLKQV